MMRTKKVIAAQLNGQFSIKTISISEEVGEAFFQRLSDGLSTPKAISYFDIAKCKVLAQENLPELVTALEGLGRSESELVLIKGLKLGESDDAGRARGFMTKIVGCVATGLATFIGEVRDEVNINVGTEGRLARLNFHLDFEPSMNHFTGLLMVGHVKAETFFARGSHLLRHLDMATLELLSKPLHLSADTYRTFHTPLVAEVNGKWVFHENFETNRYLKFNPFLLYIDPTKHDQPTVMAYQSFLALQEAEEYATFRVNLDRGDCVFFNNQMRTDPLYHGRSSFVNEGLGRTLRSVFIQKSSD